MRTSFPRFIAVVAALCIAVLTAAPASGEDWFWDGEGPDANFLRAENWAGDAVPDFGRQENLFFGEDFASGTEIWTNGKKSVGGLFFEAPESMRIAGERIALFGGLVGRSRNSVGDQEVGTKLGLHGGAVLFNNGEFGEGDLVFSNTIRGRGPVRIEGNGQVTFSGDEPNTYVGTTRVGSGLLVLGKTDGVTSVPGKLIVGDDAGDDRVGALTSHQIADSAKVVVNPAGTLFLENVELFRRLVVREGAVSIADGAVGVTRPLRMFGGTVEMGEDGYLQMGDRVIAKRSDTTAVIESGDLNVLGNRPTAKVLDGESEVDMEISASWVSPFGMTKIGRGLLELSSDSADTYAGPTLIRKGTVRLSNEATFGSTAGVTEVRRGAAVELNGVGIGNETLVLRGFGENRGGALRGISGENTWGGTIVFDSRSSIGVVESAALDLSGQVIGGGGLRKVGAGALTLSGDTGNDYSGVTRVYGGTLELDKDAGLAVTGNAVVGDGAGDDRLVLLQGDQMPENARVRVNSSGTLLFSGTAGNELRKIRIDRGSLSVGTGTVRLEKGVKARGGNTSIADGGEIELLGSWKTRPSGQTSFLTGGDVDLQGRDRTFRVRDGDAAIDLAVDADITNGGVTKTGSGRMTITGDSTWAGPTLVKSGVLEVLGTLNPATRIDVRRGAKLVVNSPTPLDNPLAFAPGSTLGGSGTIASFLQLDDGVRIAPGNSPGTLTTADLVLSPETVLDFELAQAGVVGGGVNDLIRADGDLTLDGVLTVRGLAGFDSGTYRLFEYTGALVDNGLIVGDAPEGHHYTIDTATPGQIDLHVAPEPLSIAVLLGGGALLAARRRRRR